MIRYCILYVSFVLLAACAAHAETGFLRRTVAVEGTTYRYVVYVPAEWTATKKWPVILFLHGSIASGRRSKCSTAA
jgi:poly(3-hydroxybutyrate) depolymerase